MISLFAFFVGGRPMLCESVNVAEFATLLAKLYVDADCWAIDATFPHGKDGCTVVEKLKFDVATLINGQQIEDMMRL